MTSTSFLNPFLQQESLGLMFVALGLAIIGMGYGRLRSKESLVMHRWIMSGAIILNLASILLVMLPSMFQYYTNLNVNYASTFSVLQVVHAIVGGPTVTLTMLFLFKDLPQPTARWMQITAVLWVLSVVVGAAVYYTMPS